MTGSQFITASAKQEAEKLASFLIQYLHQNLRGFDVAAISSSVFLAHFPSFPRSLKSIFCIIFLDNRYSDHVNYSERWLVTAFDIASSTLNFLIACVATLSLCRKIVDIYVYTAKPFWASPPRYVSLMSVLS